jgi:hypothetical protein
VKRERERERERVASSDLVVEEGKEREMGDSITY